MIACNMVVVGGCIHSQIMKIQIGIAIVVLDCIPLRTFIAMANEIGIYSVLETQDSATHELLDFIYEEFKDAL